MDISLRRDGFVLLLLIVMVVMLGAALTGAYRVFGYAFVALVGSLSARGFVRRGDRMTWIPPVAMTAILLTSFAGMFANEATAVRGVGDTVLGFQPGTAFLIYGVWIPAFFTIALSFALMFDRLYGSGHSTSPRKRENR